jgi:hypothetical protein
MLRRAALTSFANFTLSACMKRVNSAGELLSATSAPVASLSARSCGSS